MAEKKGISDYTEEELKKLTPEQRTELLDTGEVTEEVTEEPAPDDEPVVDPEPSDEGEGEPAGEEPEGEGEPEPTDEELAALAEPTVEPDDPIWREERSKRQKAQRKIDELAEQNKELATKLEAFERIMAEATGGEPDEDEDDIEIPMGEDVDLETYTEALLKKVERIVKGATKTEEVVEPGFRTVSEEEMAPPRYVDPHGNDYSGYVAGGQIEFREGRRWELVRDEASGKSVPVFDARAVYEVDEDTVERFGENVFHAMWGREEKPGPLAEWRADDFKGFLIALNDPDPPRALFNKYLELRGKKGAPVVPLVEEDEPRGFGAQERGSTGARPSSKKFRTIREVSDDELMQMSEEERAEYL